MQDYSILDTIEKYDTIADTWTIMYFKLPKPLAKLGSCLVNDESIMIAGGMSKDFDPSKETYMLNLTNLEWTQKASMCDPRLPSSGLIFSEDLNEIKFVYAIGGNKTRKCERYNVDEEKWELIPSFEPKVTGEDNLEENYLFTYTMCCS